jgi:methyltransferase (TIGR00027 family)
MQKLAEWDIVTGVGFTALTVAALRAIETNRNSGSLVNDPYSAAFVRAAPWPGLVLPTRLDAELGSSQVPWESVATYIGVRSKFFDDFCTGASAEGLDQVVLLAAGLDTRAFRLDWPPATTVYELDAPKVLAYKDQVLADQGARERCARRLVGVDLRVDWVSPLLDAGFDSSRPAAWLVEGLLPYLPYDAKDSLFSRVHELSPAGSRISVDHISAHLVTVQQEFQQISRLTIQWIAQQIGLDLPEDSAKSSAELFPVDQDYDPAEWLVAHGWVVSTATAPVVAQSYRRRLDDATPLFHRSVLFITAQADAGGLPVSKLRCEGSVPAHTHA